MIEFYYNGKKICSMPIEGTKLEHILAGKGILSLRLGCESKEVEVRYSNPPLNRKEAIP